MPLPVVIATKLLAPRFIRGWRTEWDGAFDGMKLLLSSPAAPPSSSQELPHKSLPLSKHLHLALEQRLLQAAPGCITRAVRIRGFGPVHAARRLSISAHLHAEQNRTELNQTATKWAKRTQVEEHLLRKIIPQLVTFCKIQSRRDRH